MSLISETVVHVLSATETVASAKLQTESTLPGQVTVSEAVFTVTVGAPLAAGVYTVPLDIALPPRAFVYNVFFDIAVPFAGTATNLGVGTADAEGILSLGYPPLVAWNAFFNLLPNHVEVLSSPELQVTVQGGNLTAGSMTIKVLWA